MLPNRVLARLALLAASFSISALPAAEKKPFTLDAVFALRGGGGDPMVSPAWAPGGKRFVYLKGGKLTLYDASSKSEKQLLAIGDLENTAVKPRAEDRFGWQNRRVRESEFTWSASGKELLLSVEGDVFLWRESTGKFDQLTTTPEMESDAKLSPDGARVAFRIDDDLYSLDIASKKTTRLTFDGTPTLMNGKLDWVYPEELDLGSAFWWSPDSSRIAYLQFDTAREFVYPQVDLLGLRALAEPERYPQAGTPNADVRLGVTPVSGPIETRWMDLGDTRDALIARVDWIPGSAKIAVQKMNRVQNRLDLFAVDPATGQVAPLLEETDKYWINYSDTYRFLSNGTEFIWSSERDGYRHLYLYGIDGKPKNRITEGAWEVTGLAAVDETARQLYYVSTEASPLERQLYRVGFDGQGKTRVTQQAGTHGIQMSPACDYFLDRYSTRVNPPSTTLRGAGGEEVAVLRPSNRKLLDEYDVLPTEIVEVPATDGTKLYAGVIKPKNMQPGKKYPVIVSVYGGPHAQSVVDAWRGAGIDQVFAANGYIVWQLDNRGSSGRGHVFETPLYRRFGKTELADQIDGVNWLLKQGYADGKHVAITGWSYGGYMTLYSLLNAPEVFRAGIAGAPVTDWHNYDTIYTERYMGLPAENERGYVASSAVTYSANLKGKLLMLHNLEDDNVLFQNSMQMAAAFERDGKDFRMIVYPQKTHGVGGKPARQMYGTMMRFFDEALR